MDSSIKSDVGYDGSMRGSPAMKLDGTTRMRSPRAKRNVVAGFGGDGNRQRSTNDDITSLEKSVDEGKAQLEAQLFLLRTQITRIEELERLVETGTSQLAAARRRREGDVIEMDQQRRQLQLQLERQLVENRNAAAQLAVTQAKNEVMSRGIRAQVVSLMDTFSPQWEGRNVKEMIRENAMFSDNLSNVGDLCSSTGGYLSPEAEAEALKAVFDLRGHKERLQDVVRWKQEKDLAEAKAKQQAALDAAQQAQAERDDEAARLLEERLTYLYNNRHVTPVVEDLAKEEQFSTDQAQRPASPKKRLLDRYAASAQRSIKAHAEETLH